VRWFTWYARRFLRKNFHAVRLARATRPAGPGDGPLVVVLNHPSWHDPLFGMVLAALFPQRKCYVPIDAAALEKYRIFARLGFFGVEQGTRQGGTQFLRTSLAVLAQPATALWVTAQGRFTDPRERPLRLRPGLGHLLRRLSSGVVLPLALEYPFWEERYPEALARFGAPIAIAPGRSADEWTHTLEAALTSTQDALAADALRRDAAAFDVLVGGSAGIGGVYDLWRRLKAWLRGERFRAAHGDDNPAALGGVS
jgi:1-acyl-sn-glycerol-3-phosphate acyltransferase